MALPAFPSTLDANDLAAVVGAGVKNEQFQAGANVLPRKLLLIGTFDPSLEPLDEENIPTMVLSAEEVGARFGKGFNLHRLAINAFAGARGIETWVIPMEEVDGAVQATGDITFTGPATAAGTIYLYIGHNRIAVTVASGATAAAIASDVNTAINAEANLPIQSAVNGGVPEQLDITVKSAGVYGNFVNLGFNFGFDEAFPAGVSATRTNPSGGAGVPDINDALIAIGTGDLQNLFNFTDVVHGFTNDTTTIDKLDTYNGAGNDFVGNYAKTVARPFRNVDGNTSQSLSTLITFTDTEIENRTCGYICVPTSPSHPSEIGACAMGVMARIANNRAEESYIDQVLPNIIPGPAGWTSLYDNRDLAVKNGLSPTLANPDLSVSLQNVVTFYRPENVPVDSNGYRSQRNIAILQNMLYNIKLNFSQEKWQGISIVADTAKVSNSSSREKARDISSVIDDLLALAIAFEGRAWIFTAAFTIERLQAGNLVEIRAGGTGFNATLPVILSGEGGIFDTVVKFDTSLAVLL